MHTVDLSTPAQLIFRQTAVRRKNNIDISRSERKDIFTVYGCGVLSTFFSCPRTVQIPHSYRCAKYKIVTLPVIGELSWALFAVENLPEIEKYHLRSHPSLKTTPLTAATATISTGQRTVLPCAIGMSLYCIQWRCSCHSRDKRLA